MKNSSGDKVFFQRDPKAGVSIVVLAGSVAVNTTIKGGSMEIALKSGGKQTPESKAKTRK